MPFAREVTFDALAGRLEQMAGAVAGLDFTAPLNVCAKLIQNDTRERLKKGVDPDGVPHKPLKYPPLVGPSSRTTPLWATGKLAASCSAGAEGNIKQVTKFTLVYGTNLEYANIHQAGGTIKPNRAKKLAVPLTREAAKYDSPREFPRKLFIPKGRMILAEARGKKAKLVAHYALKDSVDVPARPFIGLGESLIEKCADTLAAHAERELLRALGG